MPGSNGRPARPPHDFSLPLGEGLALRLREPHHVPAFQALMAANSAHLAPWFSYTADPTMEVARNITAAALKRFEAGNGWEADLCEWGEPVGAMKLHQLDGPGGSTEVGYWLAAAHEGRGLMARAITGLLPYCFVDHGLERVAIAFDPRNERSAHVAQRLGFEPEAVLRSAALGGAGEHIDLAFYGLLREDWSSAAASATAGRPARFGMPVGDGLELVVLERPDAAAINTLVLKNRERLAPWMPWVADHSLAAQLGFITNRALPALGNQEGFECGLYLGAQPIGMMGVHSVGLEARRGSIGYWIDEEFEGLGIVTRALQSVMARCFGSGTCGGAPYERLDIRADVTNARSRAVPERLGFTFEGVLRRDFFNGERYVDNAVYSLLRSEWLERHSDADLVSADTGSSGAEG